MNKPNKTKHIDTEMVTRGEEGMGRVKHAKVVNHMVIDRN